MLNTHKTYWEKLDEEKFPISCQQKQPEAREVLL